MSKGSEWQVPFPNKAQTFQNRHRVHTPLHVFHLPVIVTSHSAQQRPKHPSITTDAAAQWGLERLVFSPFLNTALVLHKLKLPELDTFISTSCHKATLQGKTKTYCETSFAITQRNSTERNCQHTRRFLKCPKFLQC